MFWPASSISNAYIENLAREIGMGYPEDFLFAGSDDGSKEQDELDVEPSEEDGTGLLPEEGTKEDEVYLESPSEGQEEEDIRAEDLEEDEKDEVIKDEEILIEDLEELLEGDVLKVNIPRGSSLGRIASILEQEGVLTDGEGFANMVRSRNLSRVVGSGEFVFSKEVRDDWEQVLSIMTRGANQ